MGVFIVHLIEIFKQFEILGIIKNYHYFDRYKKLVTYYYCLELSKDIEKHHILPRKIFPQFLKESWNIVKLPIKAHYIAHYLLYKSIRHRSCIFAFNQMKRVIKNENPTCRLYESARIEISQIISNTNKNLKKSEKHIKAISDANKRKNTYRSPDGVLSRFEIGTQPYGWEPFQLGRKRTTESKKLIGNINSNRIWQYNELTKEVSFEKEVLTGFTVGFPPWFNPSGSKCANTIWIHNEATGENKRISVTDPIPDEYKLGRFFSNRGFEKINNKNLTKVFDLIDRKFCLVNKENLINKRYTYQGVSIDKIVLYKYNGIVYTQRQDFVQDNPHLPIKNGGKGLPEQKIPNPHPNQSQSKNEFCKLHQGKMFKDVGVKTFNAHEYIFDEKEIYVRPNRIKKSN